MWARVGKRGTTRAALLLAACVLVSCGGAKGDEGASRAEAASTKGSRSRSASPDSARAPASNAVVLFVGTSLTAGLGLNPDSAFPQLIQAKIDAAGLPYEVVNAGVSGETTSGLLRRLDWLLRGPFDVVVIESGANDGLRGTPVATIERNLGEIVTRIRAAHPAARILLAQMEAPPNLGNEYTAAFRAMFPRIAAENGATLVPFILDGVAGVSQLNQGDGIHPNQQGEHRVAENVWKVLEPALRKGSG